MVTNRKPPPPTEAGQGHAGDNYDVYSNGCPARAVLDHLGDKWALLVLHQLCGAPMRFNLMRRRIDGISQKVLSQVLKRLERDGLVSRTAYATVPVTVEYALTALGQKLTERVSPLLVWAEDNMAEIRLAQVAYDARLGEAA